jgi:excisionase family DNA binding protein
MNGDILTIPEVAELLRIAEKTVYTLAQRKEIPAFKVGSQWRFSCSAIKSWIQHRTRRRQSSAGSTDVAAFPDVAAGSAPKGQPKAKRGRRR